MARGRPSAYENRIQPHLKQIAILRSNGFTHEEIISMLGIATSTYHKYKAEVEEFTEALKKSDEEIIAEMEDNLYALANGKVKTSKIEYRFDEEGNKIPIKETVEQLPPNGVALFFGLTNLSKGKWKHKQDVIVDDMNDDILPPFEDVIKNASD